MTMWFAIIGAAFGAAYAALTPETYGLAASVDTHPKDGDVKQAPLVSGAVPQADAQRRSHDD